MRRQGKRWVTCTSTNLNIMRLNIFSLFVLKRIKTINSWSLTSFSPYLFREPRVKSHISTHKHTTTLPRMHSRLGNKGSWPAPGTQHVLVCPHKTRCRAPQQPHIGNTTEESHSEEDPMEERHSNELMPRPMESQVATSSSSPSQTHGRPFGTTKRHKTTP